MARRDLRAERQDNMESRGYGERNFEQELTEATEWGKLCEG
jgi:hypothetical protein